MKILLVPYIYNYINLLIGSKTLGTIIEFWGIVPFVATLLKGRFVVFLKWLFTGYFRLG